MKLNSKFLFSIIILTILLSANICAQTFKLEMGYANPSLHGKDTSTTYFNSLRVGPTVEFKLKKRLSLLTGALYDLAYSKRLSVYPRGNVNFITVDHVLNIPVRLNYNFNLSKQVKVFAFGGPNLQIGLGGFRGITSTLDSAAIKFTKITSKTEDLYSSSLLYRVNLQLGLGGGIQWKKYLLKSGYDFGLLNLNHVSGRQKLYEGAWYITFGVEL